jgi:hypothetical protein
MGREHRRIVQVEEAGEGGSGKVVGVVGLVKVVWEGMGVA